MARYDYRCPACGIQFEVEHPMAEHPTITCPECGKEAQQVFGASGIVFKGSGFYNTDQRGKSGATNATSSTSTSSKSSTSSSDSKGTDSKTTTSAKSSDE